MRFLAFSFDGIFPSSFIEKIYPTFKNISENPNFDVVLKNTIDKKFFYKLRAGYRKFSVNELKTISNTPTW